MYLQARWVEAELSPGATAGAAHVVILSHITPFMGAEDEEVAPHPTRKPKRQTPPP